MNQSNGWLPIIGNIIEQASQSADLPGPPITGFDGDSWKWVWRQYYPPSYAEAEMNATPQGDDEAVETRCTASAWHRRRRRSIWTRTYSTRHWSLVTLTEQRRQVIRALAADLAKAWGDAREAAYRLSQETNRRRDREKQAISALRGQSEQLYTSPGWVDVSMSETDLGATAAILLANLLMSQTRTATPVQDFFNIARSKVVDHGGQVIGLLPTTLVASFEHHGKALEAAMSIQRTVAEYNTDSQTKLEVRISVAPGNQDRFDSAFRIANELVKKASAGEVLVPQAVGLLTAPSGLVFEPKGTRPTSGTGAIYKVTPRT